MIAAIDFGASMTKAALYQGSGTATGVPIDNMPESSSAVFLQPDGALVCGRAAENNWRRPERLQTALKRRINRADAVEPVHQDVEFDVTTLRPLVRCVATVLGHAWTAIRREAGDHPVSLLLTHPVGWTEPQCAALLEAAELAGAPVAGLVSEAEAVGWHVCAVRRPAGPLLVVDLGASTLDIAVLDVGRADAIEVLHSDGDNSIGGDDFDLVIIDLVRRELNAQYEITGDADDAALVKQFTELWESRPHVAAREAERIKLTLATAADAGGSATFAHQAVAVELTWHTFTDSTQHLVDRIIRRVRDVISHSGVPPRTMVVSGGAARLPSIHNAMAELAQSCEITVLDWAVAGLTGTVTSAAALGATRVPEPWRGTNARAIRPATLTASRIWPGERHLVAVPTGVVVQNPSLDGSDDLVLEREAHPAGATLLTVPAGLTRLSYDPFGRQLVTASRTKAICTWRLEGLNGAHRPRVRGTIYWRGQPPPGRGRRPGGTVTAVAARGPLVAWTESDGPGAIIRGLDSRRYRTDLSVRWLAFTDVPHLLVVADDRLVLVDPATAAEIATLRSATPVVVAADGALVFTALAARGGLAAAGTGLCCYHTGDGRFGLQWRRDNIAVAAMAVGRLDERALLAVFDADGRVYRALDAQTGEQIALKDAGQTAEPADLMTAGDSGVFYVRHADGGLSVLTFAGAPR